MLLLLLAVATSATYTASAAAAAAAAVATAIVSNALLSIILNYDKVFFLYLCYIFFDHFLFVAVPLLLLLQLFT